MFTPIVRTERSTRLGDTYGTNYAFHVSDVK